MLDVELPFDGLFLVNDPARCGRGPDEPDHTPRLTADGYPLLPASSIRGAIRSQAERIARTLHRDAIGDPHRPRERPDGEAAWLERVFGFSGQVAALEFEDFLGTAPLSGLMQGLEPFNLEKYRRIRGDLTLDHVREFLRRFLELHSTRIEEQNGFWAFNTPKVLTGNLPARYERVTFDRSQAITAESVQFVGLGHPLLDAILNHCQDDSFGGEVTVFPPDSGVATHLRVLYQFAFRHGEQLVERGLLVVAINQQGAYDTTLGSCLPTYVSQGGTPTNGQTRDWLSSAEQVAQLQLEQKHEALRSQHGPNLSVQRRMVGAAVFR